MQGVGGQPEEDVRRLALDASSTHSLASSDTWYHMPRHGRGAEETSGGRQVNSESEEYPATAKTAPCEKKDVLQCPEQVLPDRSTGVWPALCTSFVHHEPISSHV